MSDDMYNFLDLSDNWRSNLASDKFNIIAHHGYLYRVCDVAGSTFVVPCTDDQIKSMYNAGALVESVEPVVDMAWTKIPANLIRFAWKYFAAVYEKSNCEAAVLLFYNSSTKAWRLLIPLQYDCSHASVKYANPNRVQIPEIANNEEMQEIYNTTCDEADDLEAEGFSILGTIHSHCDFDAFHSSVDDADEMKFDGVHITIGHVNTDKPSFAARLIVNGTAITKEIGDIAEVKLRGKINITEEMLARHHKQRVRATPIGFNFRGAGYGSIAEQRHNIIEHGWHGWESGKEDERRKWIDDPCPSPDYSFDADDDDDDDCVLSMIDIDEAVQVINPESGRHCIMPIDDWNYYKKDLMKQGFKLLKKVNNGL